MSACLSQEMVLTTTQAALTGGVPVWSSHLLSLPCAQLSPGPTKVLRSPAWASQPGRAPGDRGSASEPRSDTRLSLTPPAWPAWLSG